MSGSTTSHFTKLVVKTRGKTFRESAEAVEAHLPDHVPDEEVYVKVAYAGINAADYMVSIESDVSQSFPVPFNCGLEGVGTVVKVGSSVLSIAEGDAVAFIHPGTFAEFISLPAKACIKIPAAKPEYVVLLISGLTAAISIGDEAMPKKGEVALVTAAAGGTGQIAVQLLKHVYGCHVIGTCSSPEKGKFLHSIGCDDVINYKSEDLDSKLTEYAPKGLDIVYECVGGNVRNIAITHAAIHARIVLIGAISTYLNNTHPRFEDKTGKDLYMFLMHRCASLHGFFLLQEEKRFHHYFQQVLHEMDRGKLKVRIDHALFKGVTSAADALDYLYSGKSMGKVILQIS